MQMYLLCKKKKPASTAKQDKETSDVRCCAMYA